MGRAEDGVNDADAMDDERDERDDEEVIGFGECASCENVQATCTRIGRLSFAMDGRASPPHHTHTAHGRA